MNKEFKAVQKFLIASPRKLRLVVAVIKKMKPAEAVEKLPFVGKRAGEPLAKVIKSALANAKTQGVGEADLTFKEIQIGEGPRLKRGRAASRGRWNQFKKRMSHIRIILVSQAKPEAVNSNPETKQNVENPKSEVTGEEKKDNGTKS
jgi:large subunit ribosomal protein L22